MAITNGINNASNAFTSSTTLTATSGAITATAGDVVVTAGNVTLPATTSTTGQITFGGTRWLHEYGAASSTNIFIGFSSGNTSLTTATAVQNTCIGDSTGTSLTSGDRNVFIGSLAGNAATTAGRNVGAGYQTLKLLAAAGSSYNLALGYNALSALTTGTNNIAIGACDGAGAGSQLTGTETDNIYINHVGVTAETHAMRLGTTGSGAGQVNATFIAGIAGVTVANSAAVLISTVSEQLGTVASSIRFKENIKDMGEDSSGLMNLRPVSFTWKKYPEYGKQYGLIAEEVKEIYPDLISYDKDGEIATVQYHVLPAMLLNELQKQAKMISDLEAQIVILEGSV